MLPVPEQRKHSLPGSLKALAALMASLQRPSSDRHPFCWGRLPSSSSALTDVELVGSVCRDKVNWLSAPGEETV